MPIGRTYQEERKKKKYTQPLTKKTKERVKTEKPKKPSREVLNNSLGGRAGQRTERKIERPSKPSKPSKPKTNMNVGGSRIGYTKYKPVEYKGSTTKLTDREKGLKQKYEQAGRVGLNTGGKDFLKAVKSGVYSGNTTDKEKANVAKSIQEDYIKKNKGNPFIAGATKSDVFTKAKTKAITGKDIDLSPITKSDAYKKGDVAQEVASYFVAPTDAVGAKIGEKLVTHAVKKALKKEGTKAAEKLASKGVNEAVKKIGGEGIAKASTKKANKKLIAEATKEIKDKATKKAVKEAGEKVVESKVKKQLARRGGDVIANAPLNARYAVNRATDDKGNTDWGEAAKDFALNTGLDIGIGGGIDSITGKVRKSKALKRETVAKYSKNIKGGITRSRSELKKAAEKRAAERELARAENEIKVGTGKVQKKKSAKMPEKIRRSEQKVVHNPTEGYNIKRGKSVQSTTALDKGKAIKRQYDRIDELEASGAISKRQARYERKAITEAAEKINGGRGVAYRSKDGIKFARVTKKGLEEIDRNEYGKALTIDKRFEGKASKLKEETPKAETPTGDAQSTITAEKTQEPTNVSTKAENELKSAENQDPFADIETLDNEKPTEDKLREIVADEKADTKGATKSEAKHTGKDDDTITAAEDESMREVDSVKERTESRTTHDDNLTEEGKADRERINERSKKKEELSDQYYDENYAKWQADKEATAKQQMKELDERALSGERIPKSETATEKNAEYTPDGGIVRNPEKKSGIAKLNKGSTSFYRTVVDSLGFTERAAQRFAKDNNMPEFANKMTGDLNNLRQASQQAAHSLEHEQIDIHGNKVGKSGKDIVQGMEKRGTYKDVEEYLLNMHHADRMDNAKRGADGEIIKVDGKEADKRIYPDKTPEEARAKAEEIFEKYKAEGREKEFMNDVTDVIRYFRNDLRSQMLSGVISKDTFYHYIDTYPNYVPTHRVDNGIPGAPKVNQKSAVEYTATGSDKGVLPLYYQMQISTNSTFGRSAMNDVSRNIAEMNGVPKEVYDFVNPSDINPIDTGTFFDIDHGKLRFTENGEWREIDVDKNFIKDLKDAQTNYFSDSTLLKGFTKLNQAFKALITSYSPTFMIRNFFRDVPEGAIQSQSLRHYAKNFPGSFKSIATNDDWYRAYVRQGGSHAQFINPEKIFNKEWKVLTPLKKIERLNEITEQIPRMAEFKGYLEKIGKTPQTATVSELRQASQAAADVTVNFGRSGSVGRLINKSIVPFFNPAIQGTDKLVRVIAKDKSIAGYTKLLTKAAILGVAPAALNDMLLADDKNYKKIPERDRMINYYVPLDKDNPLARLFGSKKVGAEDGEIFLKIPKARILSIIGGGTQKAMGNTPDTSFADFVAIAKDQIGPVGIENNIFQQLYNAKNNKTWYDTPIESQGDQYEYKDGVRVEKPMHERYDANTSDISIGITKALNKMGFDYSPKRLDYLIDSYTGVAGDFALGKTKKAAQRGYWTKAFSTDTVTQSDIQSKYYDKLTSDKTSSKDRKKMAEWSDRISVVKKAIDNVQNSNSKNKEKEVRELTKLRNSLMEKAVNGKTSKDPTGDILKIADVLGAKKTFDMVANKSDKKVLKKYGKADDKFLNSYVAVKSLTAGYKGKPSKTAQAVAIVNAGGDKKVAKAFGVTQKSGDDIKSAYKRAEEYFKNGGSVEEYKSFQTAIKEDKGKSSNSYLSKAYALAKMGASDRAYALYDIKETNVAKARNMAAVGITPKQVQSYRKEADTSGNNYLNKAEVQAYVSKMKGSNEKKSVVYDSLAFWRSNGNPYGHVSATKEQATDKKTAAKYSTKSAPKKAPVTPHESGYQTENGKKKPNGKTVGSIGERIALPMKEGNVLSPARRRNYDEWKREAKKKEINLHNAFGSRIGDKQTVTEKDKPNVIEKINKNKDGSIDIKFANGEVWHNPVGKEAKDNTKLESSGSSGGGRGRRGWGRRGWGGGHGRGGSGGGSASLPKVDYKPVKDYNPILDKVKVGLTKAELRKILKSAMSQETETAKPRSSKKDVYKVR